MGVVLGLDWVGVMELVDNLIYLSWHVNFQYSGLVVPVQCDATLETPFPILCYFILFLECIY